MWIKTITRGIVLSSLLYSAFSIGSVITDYDETKIQAPIRESNEEELRPTICRTREHLKWDYCTSLYPDGSEQMRHFIFTNFGENKIVPNSGFGIGRDFKFQFQGLARSDLNLLIWDMPDEDDRHGHLKIMMFFPRLVMPAIRFDDSKDVLVVTLPTKEEVIFNAKTKEVIGGVFSEFPMDQDDEGYAINPKVVYTGSGVVLEASRIADYPVGFKGSEGKNNIATIRKKGFSDCKIPAAELWYTDREKRGNVFFNKKYVSDEGFNKLLKEKCKFSL